MNNWKLKSDLCSDAMQTNDSNLIHLIDKNKTGSMGKIENTHSPS